MRRRFWFAFPALIAFAGMMSVATALQAQSRPARASAEPTLVVLITIDQMRADYFPRFASQLNGGLARMWTHGAVFTNAFQDHAITETAPGHSVTLSGRFPRSTGIITNSAGVGDAQSPLVGSSGFGASPFRFRGSTLTDWLRSRDPRSRALSVSRKDRGAILPLGRAKQEAYWYSYDGRFTTSTYYHDTLPGWIRAFNATNPAARLAGTSWTLLLPRSEYPEADSVIQESGDSNITFPHVIPADPTLAAQHLPDFPVMDSLTLAVALAGVRAMQLGHGPQVDVLSISLSTTDAVGHRYGPDSREIHDQILRVDRYLGAFFDALYTMCDSSRVIVALTADHGVAPYPGVRKQGPGSQGTVVRLDAALHAARARLQSLGVDSLNARFEDGIFAVNHDALAQENVSPASITATFVAMARKTSGVLRVDLVGDLAHEDTVHDAIARRWAHMIAPASPADAVVTLMPFDVPLSEVAEHGSPHDYDAHVPLIFYGPSFQAGMHSEFARVVDLAPTLAAAVHVTPTEPLDGHVLQDALK